MNDEHHYFRVYETQDLQDILSSGDPVLRELYRKAIQLNRLQNLLSKELPPEIKPYCRITDYQDHRLVIEADFAEASYKLKFSAPQLLLVLRQHPEFVGLVDIKIKVARSKLYEQQAKLTPQKSTVPTNSKPLKLSQDTAHQIQEHALKITDPELRTALLKIIAKHC